MQKKPEKLQSLDENLMENVTGGANPSGLPYQLYYRDNKLPMNYTVSQICTMYPEAIEIFYRLGLRYSSYAHMTLNLLCETYGEKKIQTIIYQNS